MAFEPFLQIHHHKGYQDHRLGGDIQLTHDPGKAEATFALPKLTLDRYPVKFVLAGLLLDLLLLFSVSRRSSQWRAGKSDAMLLAKLAVVPGAVDLICVHRLRIATKTSVISLDLANQVC